MCEYVSLFFSFGFLVLRFLECVCRRLMYLLLILCSFMVFEGFVCFGFGDFLGE